MEAKKRLLTYAGLKALEDELENLKVVKRKEVAGKIKEAREQGDLSENAEYDAAKDEQRDIEARIEELEGILKNAEVVVEDEVDYDKISIIPACVSTSTTSFTVLPIRACPTGDSLEILPSRLLASVEPTILNSISSSNVISNTFTVHPTLILS